MQSSGILGNSDFFTNENKGTYVRITDDKMQAWLYLAEREDHEPYEVDDLVRILVENGVLFGINRSNLTTMAKKEVYQREILVAEAEPAEIGSDGYYEFALDINPTNNNKPVIREDGSVDYQSMRAVQSVQAGTLLATYHHAVPGKAGKNVCGGEISVPQVRELVPIAGRGVYQAKDNPDQYFAEKDGKVEYNAGKLNIVNVLEFSGDVDQLTGKVEFFGDVHIQGNVEAGCVIRAGKSLVIDGVVESADLFAGGDIVLKRGIQGNQKAHIVGRGNLYADFVEHSFVKMEGDIQANSIVNSYITTMGKIKLTGKKASLIGGSVYARGGVSCNTVGNTSEIKTTVAAGVSEEMYEESDRVQRELKEVRHEIQMVRSSVTALGSRITPEMQESYKLKLQQNMAKQQSLLDEQKKVFEKMEAAKDATIQIMEMVYVGTDICIDCNHLKIDKNNRSMEYRNIAGMITAKVIAYK